MSSFYYFPAHIKIFSDMVIFSHHPKFHTHSYIGSALIPMLSKIYNSVAKFLFVSQQNVRVFIDMDYL
jgi:hypothetical protein